MNANLQTAVPETRPLMLFVIPTTMWLTFLLACLVLAVGFSTSLRGLVDIWFQSEEFSYGPILPFVCGFLIWQQRGSIEQSIFSGSWWGVALLTLAASLALVGQLGSVPVLSHVGLIVSLAALTLATTGWPIFRRLIGAFGVLLLSIPLPAFLLNSLSLEMQLLSSNIGVAIVRLFGITVYLEGNVIDLGVYKLEVAEACNGLRYLFPLLALGFLMAYLFKVKLWKRALLFLSAIPIAILMNSFRIGIIGVMVDHWGTAMAEGFLHDFQGWAVFMVSTGLLVIEMMILARVGNDRRHWREVFGLEFPPPRPVNAAQTPRSLQAPLIAAAAIAMAIATAAGLAPHRDEVVPARQPFMLFPNHIGSWIGHRSTIENVYLNALKLDDYVMADYVRDGNVPVNFYVAWYNSQRSGQSAHSPRSCLPGGGWHIDSLTQVTIPGVMIDSVPLRFNRALISQGANRQLTYYWFQQRGRVITNEYAVKWYLFWDSLTRNRTDGAMVRLIVPVREGASLEMAEQELNNYVVALVPELPRFIPN